MSREVRRSTRKENVQDDGNVESIWVAGPRRNAMTSDTDIREFNRERQKKISPKNQKRLTCLGHTLRIVHFILNAFVWVAANLAIYGGFIIGFSTNTLLFPFVNLDFMATTPVILFVEYGLLLVIVASIGCFTGTSANPIAIGVYIVLAIILLIVDLVWGICLYFWPDALLIFMRKIKESMNGYEVEGAIPIGIYPLDPKIYWDHIQLRGKCCGTERWDEWDNTTIGRLHSLPFSCCNDEYRYSECGKRIIGPKFHPYNEHHDIPDVVFQMGCFAKLPRSFLKAFKETGFMGLFIGALIILAILIAIVLLALILTRLYKTDGRKKNKVSPIPNDEKPLEESKWMGGPQRNTMTSDDDIQRVNNNRAGDGGGSKKKTKLGMTSDPEIPRRAKNGRAARNSQTFSLPEYTLHKDDGYNG